MGEAGGVIDRFFTAVIAGRGDDDFPSVVSVKHRLLQCGIVCLHAKAHINNIEVILNAPIDTRNDVGHIGASILIKCFHGMNDGSGGHANKARVAACRRDCTCNMRPMSVIIVGHQSAI
ncbi:hypothetical protein D3C86_1888400 [compost metagenome]